MRRCAAVPRASAPRALPPPPPPPPIHSAPDLSAALAGLPLAALGAQHAPAAAPARAARLSCRAGKLLLEWGGVQAEAEEADLSLHTQGLLPPTVCPFSSWLAQHTVTMVAEHVRLGARLQLYHPTELHAVLWYQHGLFALGAQLLTVQERVHAHAAEQQAAALAREASARSKGWAKRKAKGEAAAPAGPACHTPALLLCEAQRELTRGIHLLLSGLIREGVLTVGGTEFMSLHERFGRRFAHLRNLLQPAPPSYAQYAPMLELDAHAPAVLYNAAAGCLKAARTPLEAALKWPHCALSDELCQDVRAMAKVAVQNGVQAAQLLRRVSATPPGPPPARVSLEVAPHCDYPVLLVHAPAVGPR